MNVNSPASSTIPIWCALEYGTCDGQPFLVMEYVPGQSLSKLLREQGPLPEKQAVVFISQVAEALTYLHGQQIVHRDVKPENIMITPDGAAKLTDLGLLKNLDSESKLTRTSTGLGTFEYSAPEQYDDAKSADVRSDVYSLRDALRGPDRTVPLRQQRQHQGAQAQTRQRVRGPDQPGADALRDCQRDRVSGLERAP